jgi:putative ABC transport system substrate-binding protein
LWREAGALALEHRIAVAGGSQVNDGILVNYRIERSPEHRSVRRIPAIVSRILRGTPPQDIPFEGPTRYPLTLNLKTAATIGVTIPPQVMALADEVIR